MIKKHDYILFDDGDWGFVFDIDEKSGTVFTTSNTKKLYRRVHKDDANLTSKEVIDIMESV